jgi:DNA-binding NarL/FixJ family response regulator
MGRETTPTRVTTVLICDDDDAMRALLNMVIGHADGMLVIGEAGDGETAIAEATRLQPDVILLDLAMPILSGFDALPQLRQHNTTAKIIVLTGFSTKTAAEETLALGADTYLQKGTNPDTIIAAIQHVVAGTAAPV